MLGYKYKKSFLSNWIY